MATTSITLKLKISEIIDLGGSSRVSLVDSGVTGSDHRLGQNHQFYIHCAPDEIRGFVKGDPWTFVGTKN